ncbi:MAG: carbohydrate kinase family protein [bacterium]
MKPVLAIGDANTDLIIRLPAHPGLPVAPPELHGGGTISNTAVGIRRLGVPVRFAGTVGEDGYGRFVAKDLAAEGIDTSLLRTTDADFTVSVFAVISPDGDRTITVWPPEGGAHAYLEPADVPDDAVRECGWVHTSGIALRRTPVRETIIRCARTAHNAGVPVSLDLNLRLEFWGWGHEIRQTLRRLLPYVTTLFGSLEDEMAPLVQTFGGGVQGTAEAGGSSNGGAALGRTTGAPDGEAEGRLGVRTAMEELGRAFPPEAAGDDHGRRRTVVARRGKRGAALLSGDATLTELPAHPVDVVDSVGAGDAFNAGYIAACMRGLTEAAALEWGLCASAHQVAREGARALPTLDELRECVRAESGS